MTDEQREQEVVTGVVDGIIQKGPDKWQVEVTPAGSQYAKKLWTKSSTQHDALVNLIGQSVSILANVSHWEKDGKPIRSLWVDQIGTDGSTPQVDAPKVTQVVPEAGSPSSITKGDMYRISGPPPTSDPRQTSIERQTAVKVAVEYMALLPEELRSVEQMIAVAERVTLFLADGKAAEEIPF